MLGLGSRSGTRGLDLQVGGRDGNQGRNGDRDGILLELGMRVVALHRHAAIVAPMIKTAHYDIGFKVANTIQVWALMIDV